MKIRPLRSLGFKLLATVVAAGLVAYVFFEDELQRLTQPGTGALVFPQLRAQDVVRLVIERAGERAVLEHVSARGSAAHVDKVAHGPWHVVAPRHIPADEEAVMALLVRLSVVAPIRELSRGDATKAGLDAPRTRIEIEDVQGHKRSLTIGDPVPGGVGIAASAVTARGRELRFVLLEELGPALLVSWHDLRERRLTSVPVREASAVRVELGDDTASLLRTSEGDWSVDGLYAADEAALRGVLEEVATARATRFVVEAEGPHDYAAHGLDPPEAELRIDVGETAVRIGLRRDGKRLVAANLGGGPILELPTTLLDRLERQRESWRASGAFHFERKRVAAIRWSRSGALVLLTRAKDGRWLLLAPEPADAKEAAVRRLLDDLAGLRAESPRAHTGSWARFGLEPPALEIAVDDDAGRRLDALYVGKRVGEHRYARSPRWNVVFLVSIEALAAIPIDPRELVDAPATTPAVR